MMMATRRTPMSPEARKAASERMSALNAARKTAPAIHPRAAEATGERRKRRGMGYKSQLKLTIPPHLENDPNYRYYWLADRPGRVEELTKYDDYDFVTDDEAEKDGRNTGLGKRIERHAGVDQFGNPLRHFLVRKPREYHEADQREKREARAKMMAAIKRGKTPGETGDPIHTDGSYVPESGIRIGHGAYKP
jgi:hypothetical protein